MTDLLVAVHFVESRTRGRRLCARCGQRPAYSDRVPFCSWCWHDPVFRAERAKQRLAAARVAKEQGNG